MNTNKVYPLKGCKVPCVSVAQLLGRRTFDQAVVGSIPDRGVIKSPESTQPSIRPGKVNRVPALLAGVKVGCVRLCRVASNIVSSHMASDTPYFVMGFP